ncbi:MAG TPA: DUF1189 family protein [Candidatus Paceibacterota bacterium]
MKSFFETLKDSILSSSFYAVMGSRTPREGIRYFLSLSLFTSFIITVVLSIFLVPAAIFGVDLFSKLVSENYPSDLAITFNNGQAATSPEKIYNLPISSEFFSDSEINKLSAGGISNMLVIDTSSNFENISQFDNAKTMMLITKNAMVIRKDKAGFEVHSLNSFPNVTITKAKVEGVLIKLASTLKFVLPLIILVGFIALFVISSIVNLVLVAIAAVLIWALSNFAKRTIGYREAFTTALYAVTLSALFDLALLVAGRPNGLHSLTTILLIVLVWAFNVKLWKGTNLPVKT